MLDLSVAHQVLIVIVIDSFVLLHLHLLHLHLLHLLSLLQFTSDFLNKERVPVFKSFVSKDSNLSVSVLEDIDPEFGDVQWFLHSRVEKVKTE